MVNRAALSGCGLLAATFLAGCGLAASPAYAEDPPADFEISGNAAIVSEYRFRGVDLSGGDIAIQGGIDVAHCGRQCAGGRGPRRRGKASGPLTG